MSTWTHVVGSIRIDGVKEKKLLGIEDNNYNKALCSDDGGYSIFASNHQELTLFRIEDLHNHQVESAEIIKVTE